VIREGVGDLRGDVSSSSNRNLQPKANTRSGQPRRERGRGEWRKVTYKT
jgi:hypothetical protein